MVLVVSFTSPVTFIVPSFTNSFAFVFAALVDLVFVKAFDRILDFKFVSIK